MYIFSIINIAYAQGRIVSPNKINGLSSEGGIIKYACGAAEWVFAAAMILSIVFVLLAGIQYMRSGGDPGKVKEATSKLVYAAIGVAVALVAFTFPSLIGTLISTNVGKVC